MPSVLWRCWLGGRKGTRPVKNEWWGAGMVSCLERCADLQMAQLLPLPLTVSCFSKIKIGLPFWYRLTRVVLDKGPLNGCVWGVCAFSALTLLVGRQQEQPACKNEWWGVGVVICLERCADCLLMLLHPKTSSTLATSRSRLVLPFWYRLTQVVLENRLNGCSSSSSVHNHGHYRSFLK